MLSGPHDPYVRGMVAVTDPDVESVTADTTTPAVRRIGVLPSASMIVGAVAATVWLWFYVMIVIVGIWLVPSVVGFALALLMFVYLMRGAEWLERRRSEAVFGMDIPVPPRKISPHSGFHGWFNQLGLDLSTARFWKGCAHHSLRLVYDFVAFGLALFLLAFALLAPAAATAVSRSDGAVGLSFIPPALAWPLAVVALIAAAAIVVFAPVIDAKIDLWLLSPSPAQMFQHELNALADARLGAVSSAHAERHRIERDLHDSVQSRLVSLAMTIGLAQTKLDTDPAAAKALIGEAHQDAKTALIELRNVVRGIAPSILSDRGLDAALSSVVQRAQNTGVSTTLNIELPRRIPAETESVAYFVVAEALTNVAKHARATRAVVTVRLEQAENKLHVSVFDDGRGGARITDSTNATGLRGLADRVRAARGTFTVSSPAGGPTTVTAVLPCAS